MLGMLGEERRQVLLSRSLQRIPSRKKLEGNRQFSVKHKIQSRWAL